VGGASLPAATAPLRSIAPPRRSRRDRRDQHRRRGGVTGFATSGNGIIPMTQPPAQASHRHLDQLLHRRQDLGLDQAGRGASPPDTTCTGFPASRNLQKASRSMPTTRPASPPPLRDQRGLRPISALRRNRAGAGAESARAAWKTKTPTTSLLSIPKDTDYRAISRFNAPRPRCRQACKPRPGC
jgi:hypothetical protein